MTFMEELLFVYSSDREGFFINYGKGVPNYPNLSTDKGDGQKI